MRNKHISLGKITGIPIDLDYSWFLILALLTWMLAANYFPHEFKNWSVEAYWLAGLATSLFFFLSILLHELGHSMIAKIYKIKVRRITLFIFGGVSEITSEPPKSISEFWIAVAGPVTSFLLAGIFYLLSRAASGIAYLAAPLQYLAFINFLLAAFNLIPGFPLDGGRVLRSIVWAVTKSLKRATTIAANVGRFFGFLFIMFGVFQIFENNFIDGVWIAFIGWFLESAAVSQIQRQALDQLLTGHKVNEAMVTNFSIVHTDSTIREIVDNHLIAANRRDLFVKDNDVITGFLTPEQIKSVAPNEREDKTVKDVMISIKDIPGIDSEAPLLDAIKSFEQNELNALPVTEKGEYVGILDSDSVTRFIINLHNLGN
jgi:Zn-dependent protease/CBS domain-containing protein